MVKSPNWYLVNWRSIRGCDVAVIVLFCGLFFVCLLVLVCFCFVYECVCVCPRRYICLHNKIVPQTFRMGVGNKTIKTK